MTPDQALAAVGLPVTYTGLGRQTDGTLIDVIHRPPAAPYALVMFWGHEQLANVGLEQLAVITRIAAVPGQLPMFPGTRA